MIGSNHDLLQHQVLGNPRRYSPTRIWLRLDKDVFATLAEAEANVAKKAKAALKNLDKRRARIVALLKEAA